MSLLKSTGYFKRTLRLNKKDHLEQSGVHVNLEGVIRMPMLSQLSIRNRGLIRLTRHYKVTSRTKRVHLHVIVRQPTQIQYPVSKRSVYTTLQQKLFFPLVSYRSIPVNTTVLIDHMLYSCTAKISSSAVDWKLLSFVGPTSVIEVLI